MNQTANKAQIDKFKEAARALECDEDEDAFKANLRKIATAPKPKGRDTPPEGA